MDPLISVIVPVYKVEPYLSETVTCLLNQTYRNLEIILVDDGSPDRCGAMCDEYARADQRVRVIHKENGGLSSARNAGTDVCTGDYIAYVDSDDVVSVDYFEFLLKLISKYSTEMAFCTVANFQDGGRPDYDMGLNYPAVHLAQEQAMKKFLYMDEMRTGVNGKLFRASMKKTLYFTEGIYYEDVGPMYAVLKLCGSVAFGRACKGGYRDRLSAQSKQSFSMKEMFCVNEWRQVYTDVQSAFPALRIPASSRFLSACAHIFFKIPVNAGYEMEMEECWEGIHRTRWTVLTDLHARKKAWFCALLSLSGMRVTHWVGRKILKK